MLASNTFFNFIGSFTADFLDPANRLYIPTLFASIIIAGIYLLIFEKNIIKNFRKYLFNTAIWNHKSVKMDIKLFVFNNLLNFLFLALFSSFLFSAQDLSLKLIYFFNNVFGDIKSLSSNSFYQKLSYTLLSFVILDFLRFYQHYLMHKWSFLWKYHKIHHSAEVLTPLSVTRVHSIEMFLGLARTTLAIALSSSLYIYLFQTPITGLEFLGVNLFAFIFNFVGSNLRHTHLWVSFGVFEYLFISPAQHQIHHSNDIKHYDKNFGSALSIWDQFFKSFIKTSPNKIENIEFGVKDLNSDSFWKLIKF